MTGIDAGMFDLFRDEVRAHTEALSAGLLDLEADPTSPQRIEPLMRAAHSLKGAARILGIEPAVRVAHAMEDALVAAQEGKVQLTPPDIDALLKGTDVLAGLAVVGPNGVGEWATQNAATVTALERAFRVMAAQTPTHAGRARSSTSPLESEVAAQPRVGGETGTGGEAQAPHPTPPAPGEWQQHTPDFPPPPPHEPAAIPAEPIPLTGEHTMLDQFREEVRTQLHGISDRLADPAAIEDVLERLRQIRGAARVVKCGPVEDAVGGMAVVLLAARERRVPVPKPAVGWLRYTTSTLAGLIATDEETFPQWVASAAGPLREAAAALRRGPDLMPKPAPEKTPPQAQVGGSPAPPPRTEEKGPPEPPPTDPPPPLPAHGAAGEAVVRVTAESLNRLLGLAGESLVQARWLQPFSSGLLKVKKHHDALTRALDVLANAAAADRPPEQLAQLISDARRQAGACRQELDDQTKDFDDHATLAEDLNTRLYREVILSRMRPFSDGIHGLPRMVRDMARALGKKARLIVEGEKTEVDRDVLEKLEAPLAHLLRNAVDHGLEQPGERTAAGKSSTGTIRVEAVHRAGMLSVTVADDGRGVDLEKLRRKIVARGLNSADLVRRMTEGELLEFLFLPGFSTAPQVTEYSGRGVGLDVVQDTVRRVGGSVRITTAPGRGTTFHMQLPITLSVIRAVVVTVAGEPYAFPHTRIDRLLRVPRSEVRSLEHRQFVTVDGQNVGLVLAAQMLDLPADAPAGDALPVVLLSDPTGCYGLVVNAFLGEQDLVVRPLDPRLGKVPNVSAAAVLDDGSPVLIVDVEDMVRSMDQFIQAGALRRCEAPDLRGSARKKRVLVVDDSITVREVERQLLLHRGYDVTVAVDGVDGWNQVRAGRFDLLVTDVDMPRMTGLQLVQAVRADAALKELPVIIVSYKEREEDRVRGLEVGANAYLTKSSFHDNRFVEAVADLIGPA
jgi:two-component system sensor histidine kinase and response regulator WspE